MPANDSNNAGCHRGYDGSCTHPIAIAVINSNNRRNNKNSHNNSRIATTGDYPAQVHYDDYVVVSPALLLTALPQPLLGR